VAAPSYLFYNKAMFFSNFFKNRQQQEDNNTPAFWKNYLSSFDQAYARNTPIEEVRFVCFDTETTGLDPKNDQILSIGAVAIQNWEIRIAERLECLVHQEYQAVSAAIEVHGILPKERAESLSEKEALENFLEFTGRSVLLGHHVGFDISIMNEALSVHTGRKVKLKNDSIDTMHLAKRLLPSTHYLSAGELSLDHLAQKYHIPMNDRHTAAGDAYITGVLFLKFLDQLQKIGNRTLSDLLRK
jgi:DNA polymerase-3 subunit epsilon